jgi:hypothetical protein
MNPTPDSTNPKAYGASHTSFYTSEEKKDSYESLNDVLFTKCRDEQVRQVIRDLLDVCADITEALRTALVTVEGSVNDFGDHQLSVDVRFVACCCCRRHHRVGSITSKAEETRV